MFITVRQYYTEQLDAKLDELRKDYALSVHGFSVNGRYVYALVEIEQKFDYEITDNDGKTIMRVNEGKALPDHPGQFSVD